MFHKQTGLTLLLKSVNTYELKTGDIVINYGSHFKLKKRNIHLHYISFDTEEIHNGKLIPESYKEGGWRIQGNELARWSKLVDVEVL